MLGVEDGQVLVHGLLAKKRKMKAHIYCLAAQADSVQGHLYESQSYNTATPAGLEETTHRRDLQRWIISSRTAKVAML